MVFAQVPLAVPIEPKEFDGRDAGSVLVPVDDHARDVMPRAASAQPQVLELISARRGQSQLPNAAWISLARMPESLRISLVLTFCTFVHV